MVATCMRLRIRYHNKSYCQHLTVWTWSLKSIEVLELVDRRSLSLMNLSMFPKPSRSQCQLASLLKHQVGFIATIKLSTIPWASWTLRHQWSATNLPIWICMMNCQIHLQHQLHHTAFMMALCHYLFSRPILFTLEKGIGKQKKQQVQ